MPKFKIGDRVRIKKDARRIYGGAPVGIECVIKSEKGYSSIVDAYLTSYYNYYNAEDDFELLESIKTPMNLKEKFITAFLSEPEKTFRKEGITNGDGFLTSDGTQLFLSYLLQKFGADFKKDVVDLLVEKKDK